MKAVVLALALAGGFSASDGTVADAAKARDVAAVRALLKQGADVNAAQGDGMTALHWAARHGDVELSRLLIGARANLQAVVFLAGLYYAVETLRQLVRANRQGVPS